MKVVRNTKTTSFVARLVRGGRATELRSPGDPSDAGPPPEAAAAPPRSRAKPNGALRAGVAPGVSAEPSRKHPESSGRGSAIEGTVPRRCIGAGRRDLEAGASALPVTPRSADRIGVRRIARPRRLVYIARAFSRV